MTRLLRLLSAFAAAGLLVSTSAFAASTPVSDELLAPLVTAYDRAVKPGEEATLHRELFGEVLKRVQRSYAREVDAAALVAVALKEIQPLEPQSGDAAEVFRKAINAALGSLDPHSRYLDPRAQANQRSMLTGSFGGLGMQVDMLDGLVRIVSPMPGTPAERAGLKRGDLIVRFDDQAVLGMELPEAISRMRGQPGTTILLTIRRGEDEFAVPLVRENIQTQALRWNMEGDVLVLRLSSFTGTVMSSLEKAVKEATEKAAPRAVVLDMRGNGGGLLRQGVLTADAFLNAGEIVSLHGRTMSTRRSWQADAGELLAGLPMVVLLDGRSASAAELVAAALQEHGRAVVMGQRSFGKGSVQSIVPLGAEKGALRLTTAIYHGPSGRTVQRTGVGPDIELIAATEAAKQASRREADRAQALPGADEPLPPKARVEQARCPKPRPEVDAALACALAFVNAGATEPFLSMLEPAEPVVQQATTPPSETATH